MSLTAEWVQLRMFTPGRAAFSARQIRKLATLDNEKDLVTESGTVITSAQQALSKRRSWAKSRSEQTAARGEGKAVEIDNRVDRIVSALYNNAQSFVRSMPANKPEAIKANKLITELFPRGAIDITHKPFEDETAAVDLLVADLQGDFAEHAALLGLTPLVTLLSETNAEFKDALGQTSGSGVSYDAVTAAEGETQELLSGLVISILSKYRGNTEAAVTRRTQLLAPIVDQDARIAESMRRRHTVPDVDPETGAEVDPDPAAV